MSVWLRPLFCCALLTVNLAHAAPFRFGTPGVGTGLPGRQTNVVSATDGTGFLVVWTDSRRSSRSTDLFASRLDATGAVLDPGGIPLCTADGEQYDPRVVFDGAQFVVIWTDGRSGVQDQLYAAHVTTAGQVVEPDGFQLTVAGVAGAAVVAAGGSAFVAYSSRGANDLDVFGTFITGPSTASAAIPLVSDSLDDLNPALGFNGTNFLLEWSSSSTGVATTVHAARVSTTGAVIDATPLTLSSGTGYRGDHSRIDSDGNNFAMIWEQPSSAGTDTDLVAAIITSAGAILSNSPFLLGSTAFNQRAPDIAFDGTEYLVTYQDYQGGILAGRISKTGAIVDTPFIGMNSDGFAGPGGVSCNATMCLSTFHQGYEGYEEPYYRRIGAAMTLLDDPARTGFSAPAAQWKPIAATDGTSSMVVWEEDYGRGESFDVMAQLFDENGAALTAPFAVAAGPRTQGAPAVSFAFGQYLVAFTDDVPNYGDRVYFRRFSASGAPLDAAPVLISTLSNIQRDLTVSHDSQNFLIVFTAYYSDVREDDLYGVRVAPDGATLDSPPIGIVNVVRYQDSPSVAFDGSQYFIAYTEYNGTDYDIRLRRMLPDGTLLDPANGLPIAISGNEEDAPLLAFDGHGVMAVWHDWSRWPSRYLGVRLGADGTVRDAAPFDVATDIAGDATFVHDGRNFWLVWERPGAQHDLFATALTSSAISTSPAGVPWANDPRFEESPALVALDGGSLLLTYDETDLTVDGGIARGRGLRVFQSAPNGAFCRKTSDCLSGFCVDGDCCDSACGGGDPTDCLACSEAAGAALGGTCAPAMAGTTCRDRATTCDVAETCDGTATTCPADAQLPNAGACLPIVDGGVVCEGNACQQSALRVGASCAAIPAVPALWLATLAALVRRKRR